MLDGNLDIRCPRCRQNSKLRVWDTLTYSMCSTREMRRAYTQLYKEKAFKHESNTFYVCPMCRNWSRGSQLKIVNTDNPELQKLGGRSFLYSASEKDT